MAGKNTLVAAGNIEAKILFIRGQKVMLDADLAELYGVETKRLNEQVRRNSERFPEDFMFRLTAEEKAEVVANCDHLARLKYSPSLPYAFTEHGTIMAANIINSPRAVEISVHVVRAFVRLRELVSSHKELAQKLNQLERKVGAHDRAIAELINAIRELIAPAEPKKTNKESFGGNLPLGYVGAKKRPIGFAPWKDNTPHSGLLRRRLTFRLCWNQK